MVPVKILESYHARLVSVRKDQFLFEEGDQATDFFQVEEGQIKMFVLNEEGREFTHGVFEAGESFAEPALLGDFPYPASAVAVIAGKIWRLPKQDFLELLKDHFELHLKLDRVLCQRLQYKTMILTEISTRQPAHRLKTILTYIKSKMQVGSQEKITIPYTRQELADMTGLRVETVIRTIKKMEQEGALTLVNRKIKI